MRSDESIQESIEQYRRIFDQGPFGMVVVDPSLRFVKVNEAFCELVGHSQDELVGKILTDVTHPDDVEAATEAAREAFAGGRTSYRVERRYLRKDGEIVWLAATGWVAADDEETPLYGLGVFEDITVRKRTEHLLARSEGHFRAVAETATDGIVSANSAGEITFFNEAAEKIFGYSADEVAGRSLTTIMPDRFHADHRRGMRRFLETGEASLIGKTVEVAGQRRDGSEVPIELAMSSWGMNGEAMFTAVLRDITERKRVEAEAARARDEFLGLISHDLRTPLTSIRGYLELILEGEAGAVADEARTFLEVVSRNAARLERLVGDLLFAAQVELGEFAIERAAVDVHALVRECVEAAKPRAASKGMELTLRAEPTAESLGDRDRLCQMFDNLISNALKYSHEGGQVEVELRSDDGHLTVEVRDSGIGIAAADRERLFESFFRASGATSRGIQGTGLGLAIVKAVAEGHGGHVLVESEEGEGSVFRVELPLAGVSGRNRAQINKQRTAA